MAAAASLLELQRQTGSTPSLDPEAEALLLCGELPPERSLFRGIGRVPPAHELDIESGMLTRYWTPPPPDADGAGLEERASALRVALIQAVRAADSVGSVAVALSGGLDSGMLLALASEASASARAYTQADDFTDDAELLASRAMAVRFGDEQVVISISEEDLPDHVHETVIACEEPIWNGGAVARHLFFREVRRQGETRLLSGAGADEVLCGNPAGLRLFERRRAEERALALTLLTPEAASSMTRADEARGRTLGDAEDQTRELMALQERALLSVLPESTLPPECRTSAAEGLAVALPYLDAAVCDLALQVPPALRASGDTGKLLLREAARGLLPDEVRLAPKRPRLAPSGGRSERARRRWLELYDEWLSPAKLHALAFVQPGVVRRLLEDFTLQEKGEPDREICDAALLRLTSLVMLAREPRTGGGRHR